MNPFQRPQITDELLSAYLDNAVTIEEKSLIEKTVKNDASVAWRLESLRQTVALLHALPDLPLPRSFMLTEADVASQTVPPIVAAARRSRPVHRTQAEHNSFWQSFVSFLQGGSPLLRNLATAGLTVWLILFGVTSQLDMSSDAFTSALFQSATTIEKQAVSTNIVSTPPASIQEVAVAQVPSVVAVEPQAPDTGKVSAAMSDEESPEQKIIVNDGEQANSSEQTTLLETQIPKVETSAAMSAQIADTENANPVSVNGSNRSADPRQISAPQPAIEANRPPGADAPDLFAEAQRNAAPGDIAAGEITAASAASAFAAEVGEDPVSAAAAPITADAVSNSRTGIGGNLSLDMAPQPPSAKASAQSHAPNAPLTQPNEPATLALQPEAIATAIIEEPAPVSAITSVPEAQKLETQPAQTDQQRLAPVEAAVEVALAKEQGDDLQMSTQISDLQQVRQRVSTPVLDQIRLQWAQFVVAMVTAVLALFWLASQGGKRRR